MKRDIEFEDAQKLKQQYPETFYAPDAEELASLQPGDFVKVCAYRERFWAEVVSVEGNTITARVDNNLIMWQLKYNDTITFEARNVYDITPGSAVRPETTPQKKRAPGKSKGKGLRRGFQ